jgi:hypothetical protein
MKLVLSLPCMQMKFNVFFHPADCISQSIKTKERFPKWVKVLIARVHVSNAGKTLIDPFWALSSLIDLKT